MKHQNIMERLTLADKCRLLSGKDMWSTHALEGAGIQSIILSDGPSGVRRQLGAGDQLGLNESEKATCFPSASTIANSWDVCLAETIGQAIGREANALGVDVILGPGLNVKRSPLCGRNFEYYSEDPYLSGKLAAGTIRGLQSENVSACPKHFAVNSQELHRMASDSIVDERTLREIYLTNFEIAVKEGHPKSIMSSYNAVNGVYANENAHLLKEILRDEWGFDGFVVTDWGGNNDFVEGVRAGSNLEMPGTADDSACQLYEAVTNGRIDEAEIDARVDELLDVIFWLKQRKKQAVDMAAQNNIARQAAERSAVLLKNDNHILPLKKDAQLVIIGDFADVPRYQGSGSSRVNTNQLKSTLDMLETVFTGKVNFERGFTRPDVWDEQLAAQAATQAEGMDAVVMFLGLPEVFEAEGLERTDMQIPQNQIRLLEIVAKANPNIVIVFSGGCAVEMPWLKECKALLWAGLGGQAGAEAILNVLCGKVNPSGKLAETFPVAYADLPVSRYYPGRARTCEYREGLFIGYRYTETAHADVSFPFGHGLSYTTFAYSNLSLCQTQVTFDLTNTGNREGDEIAQLYVTPKKSDILRPEKELKGFVRVHLKKGETKQVTIPLDDKAFRYFNTSTNHFEIQGGEWVISVGASVRNIRLTGQLTVSASTDVLPDQLPNADMMNVSDEAFARLLGHAIPPSGDSNAPLTMNDPIDAIVRAKNPIARFIIKRLLNRREKSIAKGEPDLNILFITNMPFRGIAKMMNGMVSVQMAEDLVFLCNGHFFRGLGRLIKHFFARPKLNA